MQTLNEEKVYQVSVLTVETLALSKHGEIILK